jgi:hypothetical protein
MGATMDATVIEVAAREFRAERGANFARNTARREQKPPREESTISMNGQTARTVMNGGVMKRLVTLDDLNARFALLEQEGSPSVYVSRRDFLPIQDCDLRRRLANEVVAIGEKDGKPVHEPAAKTWMSHAGRHVYRRVVFTNAAIKDDCLNLYRGLGVTPKPGKCEKIVQHIREVICASNGRDADAFVRLLAWQLQNVGKPSRTIVVLKSKEQQAGKGIILGEVMGKIWGASAFTAAATDQVLGRFNSAIRGRAFIFLDEVLFSGDRKAADGLKSLSTATVIGIEEKGLPVVQCPVAVNLWLASNHANAAHIEERDARYWVLDVSPHRVGDDGYFRELAHEIENGGREAFAHYLLNLDVSGFVPWRNVPKDNAAKAGMVRRSVNPYDARHWLDECATTERLIGRRDGGEWVRWIEGETLPFAALADAYREWMKGVKSPLAPVPTPAGSLGEILGRAGFVRSRTRDERRYAFPAPWRCLSAVWSHGAAEAEEIVF